jgi:type IV pilus assembly protein PilP
MVYTDDDFSEMDVQNRDPFRSFAKAFKAQAAAPAQRRVLLPSTSLDEMNLIAIVTGIATPRAMLTDTAQVGHVIRRGDYIGRPEVVQTGGSEGMPVTLNWRVDRIRPGSVVLTREDPTSPDKPPLTRVMPLHEGGEAPHLASP